MSMPEDRINSIRKALERVGLRWLFNTHSEESARLLASEFDAAERFYNERYGASLMLLEKIQQLTETYAPFLQSIGLPISTEMRVVILRLIEGKEIRELKFHYVKNGESTLEIRLNEEYPDEPIIAQSPWDALLLPQLGYMVSDERLDLGGIRPWPLPKETE